VYLSYLMCLITYHIFLLTYTLCILKVKIQIKTRKLIEVDACDYEKPLPEPRHDVDYKGKPPGIGRFN